MASTDRFADIIKGWAEAEASVKGLTLIGSRQRAMTNALERSDEQSDWDFQIISSNPGLFADRAWAAGLPGTQLKVYAPRSTRIGKVPKVNALFDNAEVDFVVIPSSTLSIVKFMVALGRHRKPGWVRRALGDLVSIIRPGWTFLKGGERWDRFYHQVVAEVDDPRLDNSAAIRLAEGFVCDYIWTIRKIDRGELRAAQRMIHRELSDVNLRLLHELKLRRGEVSFELARRIERVAGPADLERITVDSGCESSGLRLSADRCAQSCGFFMQELVGPAWRWPELRLPVIA